jgi:hypothetical protein
MIWDEIGMGMGFGIWDLGFGIWDLGWDGMGLPSKV